MGEFDSDDSKGASFRRETKKRDLVPGKHTNTESLDGGRGPATNVPGRRSGTEHLAPIERAESAPKAAPSDAKQAEERDVNHHLANLASGSVGAAKKLPNATRTALKTQAGVPLPDIKRYERTFGADLSHVRVVTGPQSSSAAAAIGAKAFAVGHRIFFGANATPSDDKLLRHELAHVMQQHGVVPASFDELPITSHSDALEHDARAVADGAPTHQLTSQAAIARDDDVPGGLNALEFLHSDAFLDTELRDYLERFQLATSGPFAKYVGVDPLFERRLIADLTQNSRNLDEQLRRLVMPERLETLIDRSRGRDWITGDDDSPPIQGSRGPASFTYFKPVVLEIANALARRYDESIQRIFPRVLALHIEKQNQPQKDPDRPLNADFVKFDEVLVSHPMDTAIAKALTSAQHTIAFDVAAKQQPGLAKLERVAQKKVTLVRPKGLWLWMVAIPTDATAEQVATELFGKPEDAHRLIAMSPYWGYQARHIYEMKDVHRDRLRRDFLVQWAVRNGYGLPNDVFLAVQGLNEALAGEATDPVKELLAGPGGADFALQRAKQNVPAATPQQAIGAGNGAAGKKDAPFEGHDEADIYDQLSQAIESLTPVGQQLPLFGVSAAAANNLLGLLIYRREQTTKMSIANGEAQYVRAAAQRKLLTRISIGLGDAAAKLMAAGGAAAPGPARVPLSEVAQAFAAAIVALEIPELAVPRVEEAEQLLQHVDIAMMEAKLHEGLPGIENAKNGLRVGNDTYDPDYAEGRTRNHLEELADARRLMRKDPINAQQVVAGKAEKVNNLEFEITVGEKLRALDTLWQALKDTDDIWLATPGQVVDVVLRDKNRALYQRFHDTIYKPFLDAQKKQDREEIKRLAGVYRDLMNSKEFQDHAMAVRDFLRAAAKQKKWTKIIVGIAIAFAAFALGQWEYAAVLADGGGIFEAAVMAGVVTTASQAVLEKIIFDHNPTPGSLITGFVSNVAIFGVVGKLAASAKAAGVEADMLRATAGEIDGSAAAARAARGTENAAAAVTDAKAASSAKKISTAGKIGKYALGLGVETVFAEALGVVQGEVASLIDNGRTLTKGELGEMFVQQLVGVIGMRVASHAHSTVTELRNSGVRAIDAEVKWLVQEHAQLQELGVKLAETAQDPKNVLGVPDRAGALELMERWKSYLERERAVREKILQFAEKNPKKFSREAIEQLKNESHSTAETELARAQALLAIEQTGPNSYRCDPRALDNVLAQHKSAGSAIESIHTDPHTGQRKVTIKPPDGPAFTITEALPPKGQRTAMKVSAGEAKPFETWLDDQSKRLPGDPDIVKLRELYVRDPRAAINVAAERHGYLPHEVPTPDPLVKPDKVAPAKPGEGGFVTTGHETASAVGGGVTAIANDTFIGDAHAMRNLHAGWKGKHGHEPSSIHYDPGTNRVHFEAEIEVTGKRTKIRVEAALAPRIEAFDQLDVGSNRIVGRPLPLDEGHQILRDLNAGNAGALERLGIAGEKKMPSDSHTEFGLGETSDGRAVIVRGERGAVDWVALPGLKPRGHTHPNVPGNDIPGKTTTVPELLKVTDIQLLSRALIFPSPADFIVMAELGVDAHTVHTPFAVDANNNVFKPGPDKSAPRLEITIKSPREVGRRSDGKRVFEAKVEGRGGGANFDEPIWIIETGPNHDGELHMQPPSDLVPNKNASSGGKSAKTRATTTSEPPSKKPDDPRTAEEAARDPRQQARYQKPKYRNHYSTFAEWWEAKGKKWHPNPHGKGGRPDDHQPTVQRLLKKAQGEFPNDRVHEGGSIKGLKTPNGRTIRSVDRQPDVWVESGTQQFTVLKVYEAARQNKDKVTFKKRERDKKKQYDALGIPSHFEPVRPAEQPAAETLDDD